jgi:hypothetical protein
MMLLMGRRSSFAPCLEDQERQQEAWSGRLCNIPEISDYRSQ